MAAPAQDQQLGVGRLQLCQDGAHALLPLGPQNLIERIFYLVAVGLREGGCLLVLFSPG
jgi:hypothetical protein